MSPMIGIKNAISSDVRRQYVLFSCGPVFKQIEVYSINYFYSNPDF